jgi:tRNA nucleotidyltransferase/poly(A) polymerase
LNKCKFDFCDSDIAGERLWIELIRIAEGRNAGPILKVMLEQNIGQYLGKIYPLIC